MKMLPHQFSPTVPLLDVVTSIKADVVSWGIVFIGVSLAVYAYHRIYALVEEHESESEEAEERDEQIAEYTVHRVEADDDHDFKIKD
jgi:hypothetical protein